MTLVQWPKKRDKKNPFFAHVCRGLHFRLLFHLPEKSVRLLRLLPALALRLRSPAAGLRTPGLLQKLLQGSLRLRFRNSRRSGGKVGQSAGASRRRCPRWERGEGGITRRRHHHHHHPGSQLFPSSILSMPSLLPSWQVCVKTFVSSLPPSLISIAS